MIALYNGRSLLCVLNLFLKHCTEQMYSFLLAPHPHLWGHMIKVVALTSLTLDFFRGLYLLSDVVTGMCPPGQAEFSHIAKISIGSFCLENLIKVYCVEYCRKSPSATSI